MNKREFSEVIAVLGEYYSKDLSKKAIEVYYELAKEMDHELFKELAFRHMKDADQGRFFPTYASLVSQIASKSQVRMMADEEFEKDPRQFLSSFDYQRETLEARAKRKALFISNFVETWNESPVSVKANLAIGRDLLGIESK